MVFEGDLETVIQSLNSDSQCMLLFGHIIEVSHFLASSLGSYSFSHVKQKGNCVADKLARLAKCFFPNPQIWLEDVHSDATNIVLFDKSFLLIE